MIRRSVLALLASTAFLPITGALAQTKQLTSAETKLINDISTYNSAIHTMVGRFLQIDTKGQRIEGTFFLERPNKIRFRYNPPSREEIISVGRGFYVINRKDLTSYAYPQDKVPLREFLQDKIDLLKTNVVDVVLSKTYITITISDDTPAGTVEVSLIFDIATKDLSQWVLREPSGAETTFSLFDVQKDVPIPKSYFYIDPTYKPIQQ
ncbi:MAG: LolA [Hyphomicrobiales bacterium]|nr:LolA [Hyphomicrobiales bacterium]